VMHIVDTAIDQWQRWLTACVSEKGRRFEYSLQTRHGVVHLGMRCNISSKRE